MLLKILPSLGWRQRFWAVLTFGVLTCVIDGQQQRRVIGFDAEGRITIQVQSNHEQLNIRKLKENESKASQTSVIGCCIFTTNSFISHSGRGGCPVLKVDTHSAHVRRTKESWEDQKAG